ncbi:MAG: monofunctional biosynthetic peptidoglycan transglycosylase [Rhodothermia bacterium]
MRRLLARIGRGLVYAATIILGLTVGVLLALNLLDPPTTTVQAQRRVESWFEDGGYVKQFRFVPLEAIDEDLQWAVIASEDGRFYEHSGVDWQAVEEAVDEYRKGRRLRGASTITQQLVKNLFLTTHSTFIRKALELPLAYLADFLLPKKRILELYLNVIEWGPGVYGAEAAARYHYGTSASSLTRDQAARLAASLPDPRRRRPQRMNRLSESIKVRMGQLGH